MGRSKSEASLNPLHENRGLSESSVNPELAVEVERRSCHCSPGADGILVRQGDPPTFLYFVRTGNVELTMEAGQNVVMRVTGGPGSLIGLPAIIGRKPYTMTAKILGDADVCQLWSEDFYALMQDEPRLALNVLRILAGEIHSSREALSNLIEPGRKT